MNNSIERHIKDLEDIIKTNKRKLDTVKFLLEKFPDLEMKIDRWNNERFCSKSVNSIVTNFYSKHSCGCCSDSPLYVYPYIDIGGHKVHSIPEKFSIGQKSPWAGDTCFPEAVERIKKEDINPDLIEKIGNFIVAVNKDYYEQLEDEPKQADYDVDDFV